MLISLLVTAILGTGPAPAPCYKSLLQAPADGMEVAVSCAEPAGDADFEVVIRRLRPRRTVVRVDSMRITVRGTVTSVASPPGWQATQGPHVGGGTEITWVPTKGRDSAKVTNQRSGFRVGLLGPNAGIDCFHSISFAGGGGAMMACAY